MKKILRKISVDDVFVSPLKRKRVFRQDGSEMMVNIPHNLRPSGSMIMDAVVQIMQQKHLYELKSIADLLEVDAQKLGVALNLLTGMRANIFLDQYRLRVAIEYVTCSDLPLKEIYQRCGWANQAVMTHVFLREKGLSPSDYRLKYRPENFQRLYEWE